MSPTARTLKLIRDSGATAAVVEKWNSFVKRRLDLFGFIDVVALRKGTGGVLGYQATDHTSHSKHKEKILNLSTAKLWLECGNTLFLISWGKKGPRGERKLFVPRIEEITIGMFAEPPKKEYNGRAKKKPR